MSVTAYCALGSGSRPSSAIEVVLVALSSPMLISMSEVKPAGGGTTATHLATQGKAGWSSGPCGMVQDPLPPVHVQLPSYEILVGLVGSSTRLFSASAIGLVR